MVKSEEKSDCAQKYDLSKTPVRPMKCLDRGVST